MGKSSARLRTYIGWLLASASLIVTACFAVNCLIDPLWYLQGNVLTGINYPFNERLAKLNQFLPRMQNYDCIIFGSSRATLLPEEKVKDYHCFNMAFSDGQASEYLLYAEYLRQRGFAPRLMIVDVKREEFVGPVHEPEVPDFIRTGDAPPSIFATYLSLDPHVAPGLAAPSLLRQEFRREPRGQEQAASLQSDRPGHRDAAARRRASRTCRALYQIAPGI